MSFKQTLVGGAIVLSAAASAMAGDTITPEDIYPRIDRQSFHQFISAAEPDRDTRMIADMVYTDYLSSLEALADRTDAAAVEAGRDRLNDALSGVVILDPAELRAIRAGVREATASAYSTAESLGVGLLNDVALLLPTDVPGLSTARRDLHRAFYLEPRRSAERDPLYAGDGVDLIALITSACAPGQEFDGLTVDHFEGLLSPYAIALESQLGSSSRALWETRHAYAIARIENDDDARTQLERDLIGLWEPHYALTMETAKQIQSYAETELDESVARRWMTRVHRACFPSLAGEHTPEDQLDWMRRMIDDSTAVAEAEVILGAYRGSALELWEEAVGLLVEARQRHGFVLHAQMSPTSFASGTARDLYQKLLRNSGHLSMLERRTGDDLGELLTRNQRLQMKADLAARAFGRRG